MNRFLRSLLFCACLISAMVMTSQAAKFDTFDCNDNSGNDFTKSTLQEIDVSGSDHATITVKRFKCTCGDGKICDRNDPVLGEQKNVKVYYKFQSGVGDDAGLTAANKAATVEKIGALFQAHQEARGEDIGGDVLRNKKLGDSASTGVSFSGFGKNNCANWPVCVGSGRPNNMGCNGEGPEDMAIFSIEDGSCKQTYFKWYDDWPTPNHDASTHPNDKSQGTKRGKDDNSNPCVDRLTYDGSTAGSVENSVMFHEDWQVWFPIYKCQDGSEPWGPGGNYPPNLETCNRNWGELPSGWTRMAFGDITKIGWGGTLSSNVEASVGADSSIWKETASSGEKYLKGPSSGYKTTSFPGLDIMSATNYPAMLKFIQDKLTSLGCASDELPFRVTSGQHRDMWMKFFSVHKGDTNFVHFLELNFPCGAPEGSSGCYVPNNIKQTTVRFVMQVLVKTGTDWEVKGKANAAAPYTWDCAGDGKPAPLAFCSGQVTYNQIDSILRETVAHARFQVAKKLAADSSVDAVNEELRNCADDGCSSCNNLHSCNGGLTNILRSICHSRDFNQNPRNPTVRCKKSCEIDGGTGFC